MRKRNKVFLAILLVIIVVLLILTIVFGLNLKNDVSLFWIAIVLVTILAQIFVVDPIFLSIASIYKVFLRKTTNREPIFT